MTIADLIIGLDALRPELASYLTARGVTASAAEGLDALVDKVDEIQEGGGTGKLEDLLFPVVLDRSALTYSPGYDEVSAAVAACFQEPEKALLPVLLNTGGEIEGTLLGIESDGIIDFGGTASGTVHLYRWRLKPDGTAEMENLYSTAKRTNPAGAAQILKGYQGLTDYGALVDGEHECPASYRITLSSLTDVITEPQYLEMLDAVMDGREVVVEVGGDVMSYVVHDVDIEDAGYDPGYIPLCLYGSENGVMTYTLYAFLSGSAPMKLGSYRELGTLSKPAAAAQIVKGYRAYDDKGKRMTGTHVCPALADLLPKLTMPAGPEQVSNGYEYIDPTTGAKATGTGALAKVTTGSFNCDESQSFTFTFTGELVSAVFWADAEPEYTVGVVGSTTIARNTSTARTHFNVSNENNSLRLYNTGVLTAFSYELVTR